MPLSADVGGERVIGFELDVPQWLGLRQRLKRGEAAILSCGQPAYARTSTRGLHHFAHNPGVSCAAHGPESWQHLEAKRIITEAANLVGWDARPESLGDGWVADVLAVDGPRRVAFEVQWSRQGDIDYSDRQQRYKASGVRCVWFARHYREVPATPSAVLPVFLLVEDGGDFTVRFEGRAVSLSEIVGALLTSRCGFRSTYTAGRSVLKVGLYNDDCYKCRRRLAFWAVTAAAESPCGRKFESASATWKADRLEAHPKVRAAVQATGFKDLASLNLRSSKMAGTRYMGFGCPHCGALAGDFFLAGTVMSRDPFASRVVTVDDQFAAEGPHWCYVESGCLCDSPPDESDG